MYQNAYNQGQFKVYTKDAAAGGAKILKTPKKVKEKK